jgi:hypothetical protein
MNSVAEPEPPDQNDAAPALTTAYDLYVMEKYKINTFWCGSGSNMENDAAPCSSGSATALVECMDLKKTLCETSVAEPQHFDAALAPGKKWDVDLVVPAPTLLYTNATFLKQPKVNIKVRAIFRSDFF